MKPASAENLADLPPSCKLVYIVLDEKGELTQKEICEESLLAQRTVRHALTRLVDIGLVEDRISFADARQRIYSLTTTGEEASIAK